MPADLAGASAAEREQIAQFAAAGLGVMMGYKSKGIDPKLVILQKAIETQAVLPRFGRDSGDASEVDRGSG